MIALSVLLLVSLAFALVYGITDSLTITWASGSDTWTSVDTFVADTRLYGDYPIAPATVNQEITIAFTAASIEGLALFADGVLTIKTNSTATPDDTITTIANRPVIIRKNVWPTTTFAAAVTKFYVSNATGATVTLKVRGLKDGTV